MLTRIYSLIGEVRRLRLQEGCLKHEAELVRLLKTDIQGAKLDLIIEIVDGMDQVTIENGDSPLLSKELEAEYVRAEEGETYRVGIHRLYGSDPCALTRKSRQGEPPLASEIEQARNWLLGLKHTRSAHYRIQRARQRMKVRYLWSLAVLLALLVPVMGVVIARQDDVDGEQVILAGVVGAIGAALSGTLKLREHVVQVNSLRLLQPGIVVEPLLGSGFGLILFLLLRSNIIQVGGSDESWPEIALLAFLAGFSEPFTLNILTRVSKATEGTPAGGGSVDPPQELMGNTRN